MKKIFSTILSAMLVAAVSLTSFAATWEHDATGWWYQDDNGSYPTSSWREIDGNWYYFDGVGYMTANQWVGNYYLGSSGAMLTNTTTPDGYQVGADGAWIPSTSTTTNTNPTYLGYDIQGNNLNPEGGNWGYSVSSNRSYKSYAWWPKSMTRAIAIESEWMSGYVRMNTTGLDSRTSRVSFDLSGQYTRLRGRYAPEHNWFDRDTTATLIIYGDNDAILYNSGTLTTQTGIIDLDVDVSNQNTIRFELTASTGWNVDIITNELAVY